MWPYVCLSVCLCALLFKGFGLPSAAKGNYPQAWNIEEICLCVCNHGAYADNLADSVDWLLITYNISLRLSKKKSLNKIVFLNFNKINPYLISRCILDPTKEARFLRKLSYQKRWWKTWSRKGDRRQRNLKSMNVCQVIHLEPFHRSFLCFENLAQCLHVQIG